MMHQLRDGNQRLLHYSNPSVTHNGYATGIDGISNNATWIDGTGGCIVSAYFADPVVTLFASIIGEELLCKPNIGQYSVLTSMPGSYTYEWHKSTNGVNWGQPIGTGQSINLNSTGYSIGQTVFLRATVFNSGGAPLYAFFEVLIGDPNDANCPRSNEAKLAQYGGITVYPNPSEGDFTIDYRIETGNVPINIQLLECCTGVLLFESHQVASTGIYSERIEADNLPPGLMLLQAQIGEKLYNKLIVKQQ